MIKRRTSCKELIECTTQVAPGDRNVRFRSTVIELSSVHQAMVAIEEIDVRRALRIEPLSDLLCFIKEVREEIARIACFGRHPVWGVVWVHHWIV